MSQMSGYRSPPPGLVPHSPHSQFSYSNHQQMQAMASPGQASVQSQKTQYSINSNLVTQGTQISDKGVVSVNLVLDDLEIPFMAIRDSVRFLHSIYPLWSIPAFQGGNAYANEVGATYTIEHTEKHTLDEFDGAQTEVNVRRKKSITIKDIIDQPTFKVISFNVVSKLESDLVNESFPSTTYILVEIKPYPYEPGKFQFTVTFDGGPPDVEATYCCFCIVNPGSVKLQEESQEMRPKVYAQASSIMGYIRNFNPNDPIARKVSAANASNSRYQKDTSRDRLLAPSYSAQSNFRGSFEDDAGSHNGSKLSKNSKGYENPSVMQLRQMGRADSGAMAGTTWSTGSPGGSSSADEIKKLYELYQVGALSKQEFDIEKRKVMEANSANLF